MIFAAISYKLGLKDLLFNARSGGSLWWILMGTSRNMVLKCHHVMHYINMYVLCKITSTREQALPSGLGQGRGRDSGSKRASFLPGKAQNDGGVVTTPVHEGNM